MAANRYAALILALSGLLTTTGAMANQDVIDLLTQNVAAEATRLGDKSAKCKQQKVSKKPLHVDVRKLTQLNVSRQDAILAIAYLGLRNDYQCDNEERNRLAYALGVLEAAKSAYRVPHENIKDIRAELIYPSMRYLEMSVDYKRLSPDAREYLEGMVGTRPFDSIGTINAIPHF